jgi:Flp pilus assembly protein TadB
MTLFRQREEIRRWREEIIQKFRQKSALTPETAKTAEELGLPPRFEEAMKRRLVQSGIFVEVNGKYYLSEERLKKVEEMRRQGGGNQHPRGGMMSLRIARLLAAVLIVVLLLINVFVQSWELRIVTILIVVVWIALTLLQIYQLSRARRRFRQLSSQA